MFRQAAAVVLVGVVLGVGGYAASAATTDAPPGATALCKDGTYSFSQTRSGTCSHHGGVATWLTPAPASTAATTTASAPTTTSAATTTTPTATTTESTTTTPAVTTASSSSSTGGIKLGNIVLLAARTKTSHCVLGVTPDRGCSPGAIYTGLTKSVLCSSTFHTSSVRNVPDSEKHQVETEYGLAPKGYGSTLEIDHIVSLELGGSNDIANLFPERASPAPGFHVKDKLENKAHDLVCAGSMTLHAAQLGIATNWRALYETVYGVTP